MFVYKLDKEIDINNENIPAHLFGDMWARNWQNLFHDVKPFKNATLINVSERMVSLNYTPLKMFEVANDFFTSLGLMSAEMSYTPPGIIEKPSDRLIECHPSAWDFLDGKDFRIKMCTNVNADDLSTIHHELGHIQYFMQYKDLPLPLRNGANVGFYEAIGGTIALSAATPQHLLKVCPVQNVISFQISMCHFFLPIICRLDCSMNTKTRQKITLMHYFMKH